MTATETSRKSYKELKAEGKEMSQMREVLEALCSAPYFMTANELNKEILELDIPNGRVHARLNKLMDKGLVTEVGERPDKYTGREVKVWMPKDKERKVVE